MTSYTPPHASSSKLLDNTSAKTKMAIHENCAEVKLKLEDSDDCWCLYNILSPEDSISCLTSRKVDVIGNSGKCVDKVIKKFVITIVIDKFEYNTYDESISISGRNTTKSEFINIGQFHTVTVNNQSSVTLLKNVWNRCLDDLLKRAVDNSNKTIKSVLLIGEGNAIFYKSTKFLTKQLFNVKKTMSKSGFGNKSTGKLGKALEQFFTSVLKLLNEQLTIENTCDFIIAGPCSIKESFITYAKDNVSRLGFNQLNKRFSSVRVQTVSQVGRSALSEISDLNPNIALFNELKKRMALGTNTFLAGLAMIKTHMDSGAIEHLLVTDGFLRCESVEDRKERLKVLEVVKNHGGKVTIVSDNHHSSDELIKLSGIAALTRYALN